LEATPERRSPFMRIRVRPAAHLDRLEEVLVLLTRQELDVKKEAEASPAPAARATALGKTPANTR